MEYCVEYDVEVINGNVQVGISNTGLKLNDEQMARVNASRESGKYTYMDDDETLSDICSLAFDAAIATEKESEFSKDYIGTELTVAKFRYPVILD